MEVSSTQELSTEQSTQPKANSIAEDKNQVKGLLAEARNTRDMLVAFRASVESGTYHGSKMLDLAKGLAFMDAILKQNQAHIQNLQERLDK